ncbi:hypothetical protein PsorP6_014783 [Peronosclerospora sorghi]|uniref:Uncharacterized protein n=1 Tax=Peronosclerospora sorghi TaxID=230839 RepID=A0ACC0VV43_9STRA|nr:hypothetical protein PsorP6_014783 [Peronosclerospora sorghi]
MDFLRQLAADLHALRAEAKRKYPVVKEAVDRALEILPPLQQQYAALVRDEDRAPGPGHRLFQRESVLRPFLLTCNHTNASHKILLLALRSIQRLVSWDAIEPSSLGSLLRVLQIQAEKTSHADVQVKLLQTLLQLLTLAYKVKQQDDDDDECRGSGTDLVGNPELVMQAVGICLHLYHATTGQSSSIVAHTAAMTLRQLVSLAFGAVETSPSAKRVGVLLFQELCAVSRQEHGLWLKRTPVSPLTAALSLELVDTIVASHAPLFRLEMDYKLVLQHEMLAVIESVLERSSSSREKLSGSGLPGPTSSPSGSSHGATLVGFPLLVRAMRLASTILCHFAAACDVACVQLVHVLLELVATGTYPNAADKAASETKAKALAHASPSSPSTVVTWPVLLSLEVLARVCLEPSTVAALVTSRDGVVVAITRTTSSVLLTSPPDDFRPEASDATALRSMLELGQDHETPSRPPVYAALRVAAACQCNLAASMLELARTHDARATLATCVAVVAPAVVQSMQCVLKHGRDVELVGMALRAYHVLATVASTLRGATAPTEHKQLNEVVAACLGALRGAAFPVPDGIAGHVDTSDDTGSEDGESCVVGLGWRQVQAMNTLYGAAHVMAEDLSTTEWMLVLQAFEIIVDLTDAARKAGQLRIGTKTYRIRAFEMENEDIEQQLVMLSRSIKDFVQQEASPLDERALARLVAAVRKLAWEFGGLERDNEVATDASPHHMRLYLRFLGVGVSGSSDFEPCFVLRTLPALGLRQASSFDVVVRELLRLSLYEPSSASRCPQLEPLQTFTTDRLVFLLQHALQRHGDDESDQLELLQPLEVLARSRMKDRTLTGLLELLQSCGHLIRGGWPVVLAAIQGACDVGDPKTQGLAFKCLRLMVDDWLVSMPRSCLGACIDCIGVFGRGAHDVNIRLTAVNELWRVADLVGKQTSDDVRPWRVVLVALSCVAHNDRADVRNSALNTLMGTAVTYGHQFGLCEWQVLLDELVLPLAAQLEEPPTSDTLVEHVEKQWTEARVLMVTGLSRVVATHWHAMRSIDAPWFARTWHRVLAYVAHTAKQTRAPKAVVVSAIETLATLLHVASSSTVEYLAPVRVNAGMRVVGGALVASTASTPRIRQSPMACEPELWQEAFHELLHVCDARRKEREGDGDVWQEEEIASAVVGVLVTLYGYEHFETENVEAMLHLFATLIERHVMETKGRKPCLSSLQTRVLDAYEACAYFQAHASLHEQVVAQVVTYVRQSYKTGASMFFTRHALTSLAKVYAHVSRDAQATTFMDVLACLAPCWRDEGARHETVRGADSTAATHVWPQAVHVLRELIQTGLVAVDLDETSWRALLATMRAWIKPEEGTLPTCVQGDDDEALVLSLLTSLTDTLVTCVQVLPTAVTPFRDDVVAFLGAGIDARTYEQRVMAAYVRQVVALCLQRAHEDVATCARTRFVESCTTALARYAACDARQVSGDEVERVMLLLTRVVEVDMTPANVMDMYPALCACIVTPNRDVRELVQRLLQTNRLIEHYRALLETRARR